MRRLALAALLAAATALAAAPSASAQITVRCFAPGQTACSGQWHQRDVQLAWLVEPPFAVVAGCRDETIDWDSAGESRGCTARSPSGDEASRTVTVKVDATPPLTTGATAARAPDANGWYRAPVAVTFSGGDLTSGLEGCTTSTYAGPDSGTAGVDGSCRDRAGNVSAAARFALRFDGTPPVVRGVEARRPPDHGGWYTEPVSFAVAATDATSGLAGCDVPVLRGPDGPAAPLRAGCLDRAGNVTSRAFALPFDATAPLLARLRVNAGDRRVRLDWSATDAVGVEVVRSPGRRGDEQSLLRHGAETRLVDEQVVNGRRYEYRVTAVDQAGNAATRTVVARPGPRLLTPPPGARLTHPPLLDWTPVRGARYYNVQLLHDGRKVLSAWPRHAHLQLERSWRYRGRRELEDGRYRWLVWPGRGAKAASRYGPLVGSRTFMVRSP